MVSLHQTQAVWNRDERNRINENWQRIAEGFSTVQRQINILAGGEEVDELLERIATTLEDAEGKINAYILQVDTEVNQAIQSNNTATEDAITRNNQATQTAIENVTDAINSLTDVFEEAQTVLDTMNTAKEGAVTATGNANAAATTATEAVNSLQRTINEMQTIIANFRSDGVYNNETVYSLNSIVLFNGSSYIYTNDVPSAGNQPPLLPVESNDYWFLLARKGVDGTGSVVSVNGVPPDSEGNVEIAVAVTKTDVGLGNVDNTSDIDKPVSTAQQAAIDQAKREANSYTDNAVQDIVGGGVPKLTSKEIQIVSTEEGQTVFTFVDPLFNAENDTVLAYIGAEPLTKSEYTLAQGEADEHTITITTTGLPIGTTVWLVIFRNVPIGPEGAINAAVLQDGTVGYAKLAQDAKDAFVGANDLQTVESNLTTLTETTNAHIDNAEIHVTSVEKEQWDRQYKLVTSGGTKNAFTLPIDELFDGLMITFIAGVSNLAETTTINGKPLVNPSSPNTPPHLIQGRAYTVWYSNTNINYPDGAFFIKASATGTATAADVLAGRTFSNISGTGIVGTMVNNAGKVFAGTWVSPNGTNLINVIPSVSAYVDTKTAIQISDPNLIPTNILSGKSIFGVTGTAQTGRSYASGYITANSNGVAINGLSFTPRIIRFFFSTANFFLYVGMPRATYIDDYGNTSAFSASSGGGSYSIAVAGYSGANFFWEAWG